MIEIECPLSEKQYASSGINELIQCPECHQRVTIQIEPQVSIHRPAPSVPRSYTISKHMRPLYAPCAECGANVLEENEYLCRPCRGPADIHGFMAGALVAAPDGRLYRVIEPRDKRWLEAAMEASTVDPDSYVPVIDVTNHTRVGGFEPENLKAV